MNHRLLATLAALALGLAWAPRDAHAQCPPAAPVLIPPGGAAAWAVTEGASTPIGATGGGPLWEWDADCNGLNASTGDAISGPVFNFTAHERDGNSSSRICVRSFNPSCGAGAEYSASVTGVVDVRNVAPTIITPLLAAGIEGTAYRYGLAASDPANPPNATTVHDALTWSAAGLPPALSIDPMTGVISGTPAVGSAGTHSITVTVTDGDGGSASRSYRLGISNAAAASACPAPSLATGAGGAISVDEGATLTARASAAEPTCACVIVWDLGCDGAIDGSGTSFVLSAEGRDGPTDSSRLCVANIPQLGAPPGAVCRASASAMATVNTQNVAPTITTMSLPVGILGAVYLTQLTATDPANPPLARGFLDPIVWGASGLPPGLTLNPNTGVIVGTPSAGGGATARCYPVMITARDGDGSTANATLDLCLTASAPMLCPNASPAAARYSIPEGSTGTLGATFSAGGSCGCVIEWDFACDGVPDGRGSTITFDARGLDGFVSTRACWVGVPTGMGPCNRPGETQESIINIPNVSPGFVSTGLGPASEGVAYMRELEVTDPANPPISPRVLDPIAFSMTGAPAWLSLDPMTGILAGTPPIGTAGMSFTFTVIIDDGDSGRTTAPFTLRVLPVDRPDAGADASSDARADASSDAASGSDASSAPDATSDASLNDSAADATSAPDASGDSATMSDASNTSDGFAAADAANAMDSTSDGRTGPTTLALSGDGACACRATPTRASQRGLHGALATLALALVARRRQRQPRA